MSKRLYRSEHQRMLGGVCGGLAEYFHIDPTIVRLAWGLCVLVYGTGLLFYLLAWVVIPKKVDL